jgi:endonuclease/exonuclease/phosphatase family metal-dependent hydrolase
VRLALASVAAASLLMARVFVVPHDARAQGAAVLKVMTFNIQHGIDGTHKYNLQRAIDTIAKVQPDLVGLQEVTRNHPFYACDDQPARIAEGLKAATGRAWSVVYEQEWFTPNVECQKAGKGDGKETEGLAFLSPAPLGESSMTKLPASRIAMTVRLASAGGLPVTVTHLANGKNNGPSRAKEVEALVQVDREARRDSVADRRLQSRAGRSGATAVAQPVSRRLDQRRAGWRGVWLWRHTWQQSNRLHLLQREWTVGGERAGC